MILSFQWLKRHISLEKSPEETASILTRTGLEVESVELWETVKGGLQGVVVGKVLTVIPHPDADRLRICTVDTGEEELRQIVCGAPNVAEGQTVPVALPGSTLYPTEGEPIKLKISKIRGVESRGMICAEDELGIGKSHDGILVLPDIHPAGKPLSEVLAIESDYLLHIGLTPNRGDAASHRGTARDLSAVLQKPLNQFPADLKSEFPCPIKVELKNPDKCPSYAGVYIKGITVKESPDWIKSALKKVGMSPINAIVDIANYVMMDLGQPLHAFDGTSIKDNTIQVRNASNETFTGLDGKQITLSENDLCICDTEKPLCIAGVFGSNNSGVTQETTEIFLEAAYFSPASIRETSRRHQFFTDAAFRFARGTNPNGLLEALTLAARYIQEYCGGTISEPVFAGLKNTPGISVAISHGKISQTLGKELSSEEIESILKSLDFEIQTVTATGWEVLCPPYRLDVTREIDIIEEIFRIHGPDSIEETGRMPIALTKGGADRSWELQFRVSEWMAASGFQEILTNSLVHENQTGEETVPVLNKLSSETAVLRTSLIGSGLEVIAFNQNRQHPDLRLFEFGKSYHALNANESQERKHLMLFCTGISEGPHWQTGEMESSLYSLTKEIERLISWLGIQGKIVEHEEVVHSPFEYSLGLQAGPLILATWGKVKQSIAEEYGVRKPVFAGDVFWDEILKTNKSGRKSFEELPRFPVVKRDISLVLPVHSKFSELEQAIRSTDKKRIKQVSIFDVYAGKGLVEGTKSYTLNIQLQDEEKTLTDNETEAIMEKVLKILREKCQATLRA